MIVISNLLDLNLKEARRTLEENNFKFQRIIETTPIGIVLADRENHIFDSNQAVINLGVSSHKKINKLKLEKLLSSCNMGLEFAKKSIKNKRGKILYFVAVIGDASTLQLQKDLTKNLGSFRNRLFHLIKSISKSPSYPSYISIIIPKQGSCKFDNFELAQWLDLIFYYEKQVCYGAHYHSYQFL
jgi:hypothetical protein